MLALVSDVAVIDDPATAVVALDPVRSALLAPSRPNRRRPRSRPSGSGSPASARRTTSALERQGLVREVAQRRHGGLTERVLGTSAQAYVVSPGALGAAAADPRRIRDRLSASYLLALAARVVREVGLLVRAAESAGKSLPTLSIDAEVRFASAADRAAFAEDLSAAVRALVARHHRESAPGGRWHRVVVLTHPLLREEPSTDE